MFLAALTCPKSIPQQDRIPLRARERDSQRGREKVGGLQPVAPTKKVAVATRLHFQGES